MGSLDLIKYFHPWHETLEVPEAINTCLQIMHVISLEMMRGPWEDLDMQLADIFGNSVPIGNFKNSKHII